MFSLKKKDLYLIEKIYKKKKDGKINFCSWRITLLNSVLSATLLYFLLFYWIPRWNKYKVDQIRQKFIWNDPRTGKNRFRLVDGDRYVVVRRKEGWGVLQLDKLNKSLLASGGGN